VASGTILSVLLNTTPAGAVTPTFAAPQTFAPGFSRATASAVADFNGDGKPDLVVVDAQGTAVWVFANTTTPGSGTVTFQPPQTFFGGGAALAVADFNGDGKPDIAVAGSISGSVLLNTTTTGNVSFAARQTFAVGGLPRGMVAADLNGDGKPDLAIGNGQSGNVSVLLNTTAAGATTVTFTARQTFASGSDALSPATADLNGDGRPDLVVPSSNGTSVSVLFNTTTSGAAAASFAAQQFFAAGNQPAAAVAADFDGDGKPDLAFADTATDTTTVLSNTTPAGASAPSFDAPQTFAASFGAMAVVAADFNGDGLSDLAFANNAGTVTVLLNTTGDVVAFPQAATTDYAQTQPITLLGNAPGADAYAFAISTPAAHGTLSAVSFFGAGFIYNYTPNPGYSGPDSFQFTVTDTVTHRTSAPATVNVTVLPLGFAPQQTFEAGPNPQAAAVGDFNGDGKPDLVVTNAGFSAFPENTVLVLLNTTPTRGTTATFTAPQSFATGQDPVSVVVGDFNGDGKPDLAVANKTDNTVSVFLNTTPTGTSTVSFAAPQTFAVGNAPVSVATADLNGDGKPDLVVANMNGASVSVLVNTTPAGAGTVSLAAQQTFSVGSSPDDVIAADFNGDGQPDLAVAVNEVPTILLNTTVSGSATVTFAAPQTFAGNAFYLAAADFNGDGKPDLAGAAGYNTSPSVWLNTTPTGSSTLTFTNPQTFAAGQSPISVAAGDFNGDGRPELAVSNSADNSVSVLLNVMATGASAPAFAPQQTFAVDTVPTFVAAADFNGDGAPDLVTMNLTRIAGVSVLLNTTLPGVSPQAVATGQDQPRALTLVGAAPNNDPFTLAVTAAPAHGTLSGFNAATGQVTYTPAAGYAGPDSFTFNITDTRTHFTGTDATVSITVSVVRALVSQSGNQGVLQFDHSTGTWVQLTPANASLLAVDANGDVAGEFPGYGVWEYQPGSGWKLLNGVDATILLMDGSGDIAAEFPGFGVGEYSPGVGWSLLTAANASLLNIDSIGLVAGEFPGYGVWLTQISGGWQQINGVDATLAAGRERRHQRRHRRQLPRLRRRRVPLPQRRLAAAQRDSGQRLDDRPPGRRGGQLRRLRRG
jgi:hypothetical protein